MYLREQLSSLLTKLREGVIIHVLNDGSADSIRVILTEHARRSTLRWYVDEYLGPASSLWRLHKDTPDTRYGLLRS